MTTGVGISAGAVAISAGSDRRGAARRRSASISVRGQPRVKGLILSARGPSQRIFDARSQPNPYPAGREWAAKQWFRWTTLQPLAAEGNTLTDRRRCCPASGNPIDERYRLADNACPCRSTGWWRRRVKLALAQFRELVRCRRVSKHYGERRVYLAGRRAHRRSLLESLYMVTGKVHPLPGQSTDLKHCLLLVSCF
jgi:hypothetical protein